MLDATALQDDFARTRAGYYELVRQLSLELPQPPKETPAMQRLRLAAAIATIAGLCPVTLAEARLAARHVSAAEHAGECLQQINQLRKAPDMQAKMRAQSSSMERQSASALRSLQRLKAERIKRDGDAKQADAAVWAEHLAASAMEAALEAMMPEETARASNAPDDAPDNAPVGTETASVGSDARADSPDENEMIRELADRLARVREDHVFETQSHEPSH